MKSNELDRIIQEKLARIEPVYNPESWKLLEQKLDGGAVTDPEQPEKETSAFDHLISSKIKNLSVPYQAASWSALEGKLDGGPAGFESKINTSTEHFDNILFEKLVNYQAPYSSGVWNAIVATLQLRKNFYRLKLAESMFLLFLLLFFYRGLPVVEKQQDQTSPVISPVLEGPVADNEPVVPTAPYVGEEYKPDEKAAIFADIPHRAMQTGADKKTTKETPQNSTTDISPSLAYLLDGARTPAGSDQALLPQYPGARPEVEIAPLPSINSFRLEREMNQLLAANDLNSSEVLDVNLGEGRPIEIFAVLPLQGPGYVDPNPVPQKLKSIQSLKRQKSVRGSMFGSVDINQIITPPNFLERRFTEFNRYAVGYSTGFTLSFGIGRWEMETGMIYTAKYYSPPTVLFLVGGNIKDGYQAEGLKFFELDMFNIPLNFRYHYVNSGKWRAYGMIGASLQIAYQTHYYSETQEGLSAGNLGLSPAPSGITPGGPSNSLHRRKDISEGWLEGGPFQDNSYLSLNLGAGVERYISSRFSAFVQPTYQYSFGLVPNLLRNEIGPDKDKINTFSIYTGVRVRISKYSRY